MRRATTCAMALAVGWLTCNLAWADDGSPIGNWFGRLFQGGKSANKKTKDTHENASSDPRTVIEGKNVRSPLAQAEADYLRRDDQCRKLEEIAASTNDENLGRKVDLLRQRISEAYSRRTAYLPASRPIEEHDSAQMARPADGAPRSGFVSKEK